MLYCNPNVDTELEMDQEGQQVDLLAHIEAKKIHRFLSAPVSLHIFLSSVSRPGHSVLVTYSKSIPESPF